MCSERTRALDGGDGMSTGGGSLNELRRGRRVWVRLRLKGCPRCKGDLVVEVDQWGWYEECIQCGYLHDLQNVTICDMKMPPIIR